MAKSPKTHFDFTFFSTCLISFFISIAIVPSRAVSSSDTPTVYEVLAKYGLPGGLLPDSVVNYTLSTDGDFVVQLEKPCYVNFEYLVYYEKTITGVLHYGSIICLKGIQVKRFLFWFDVNEIRVDLPPNDSIYFQVGFINKKLDIDQFKTVHSCGDSVKASCFRSFKGALQVPVDKTADLSNEIQMLAAE